MSHDDIVFNNQNFVDNLENLITTNPILADVDSQAGDIRAALDNDDIANFNKGTNPIASWDRFVEQAGDHTAVFVAYFTEALLLDDTSEWGDITTSVTIDAAMIENWMKRSFNHFAGTFPYSSDGQISDGTSTTPLNVFVNEYVKYLTATARLLDATEGADIPPSDSGDDLGPNATVIASYKQVYLAFGFPEESFRDRLLNFFQDQLKENGNGDANRGWFIPSHSFAKWFEDLRDDFITINSPSSVGEVRNTTTPGRFDPVTGAFVDSSKRLLVIDRILRLLVEVIGSLQRISAAQAQRLNFLTEWQEAYTDLITQVPSFAPGQGNPLGGSGNAHKALRSQVNPAMQSILEKVRARRSAVQDDAKAMQTVINQSQDAANQQTQMATSLLQQLSTILSQIFR